jgi:hypothetical protein
MCDFRVVGVGRVGFGSLKVNIVYTSSRQEIGFPVQEGRSA